MYFLICIDRLVSLLREFVSKLICESVQKNVFAFENAKTAIFTEATELFISVTFNNIIFSYFSWCC